MAKCIIEALDTLRANHLRSFRYVKTEKGGEGKTCQLCVMFFICLSMLYVIVPTACFASNRNCQAVFVSEGTGRSIPSYNV